MSKKVKPSDLQVETTLRGHALRFHTTWGLFSPKQIDVGSQLLIEAVELPQDATVLDLGCGYGPIGIALAKDCPDGEVHLVDKDFVAVEYAQRNLQENDCPRAQAYLSNAFSHVPANQHFDVIASNIPAKVGKELLLQIIEEAHQRLKPGGRLYVVTIAGLKDFFKTQLKNQFGNYKKLKQAKGYVVAMASKA